MYEKPELTLVGDARDTILGVYASGDDIDGTFIWIPNQFEADTITDE